MVFKLVAIDGPLKGGALPIGGQEFLIGRKKDNHLAIPSLTVSRHHCKLSAERGSVAVCDLDSQNGTFVNGAPIHEAALNTGDKLQVGDSVFILIGAGFDAAALGGRQDNLSDESTLGISPSSDVRAPGPRTPATDTVKLNHNLVGGSPEIRRVLAFIAKVAATDSTVLITGESGAGKELVARAIHQNSARAPGPFVAVNCAALTETLLESELFGHEKGAFTGAFAQKKGKLELADGGTFFFDEIAELPLLLQSKLLRVLQERTFERVGGVRTIPLNIRIVAATNRDLEAACSAGQFRRDLFFRLNVVALNMPPLRERKDDIVLLANHFLARHKQKSARSIQGISRRAKAYLLNYEWPGNVRELENVIERAVVLGESELIVPEDLPEFVVETGHPPGLVVASYHGCVLAAKKAIITAALEQTEGDVARAANALGIQRTYLHRLIRQLNLRSMIRAGR